MKVVALDLEMEQPTGEIIQIGACIGDLKLGVVYSKFSAFVKLGRPLSPFIQKLTGITDEILETQGMTLIEAVEAFLAYKTPVEGEEQWYQMLTWGGGDTIELLKQYSAAKGQTMDAPLTHETPRRWMDIKTLYQFRQIVKGQKPQAGLAKALTKIGKNFIGRKHRADDDAVNTFRMAHFLYTEQSRATIYPG